MPHGGWAGTLAGDVFGQPGRTRGRRKYHVFEYYGYWRVADQDNLIVAASTDYKAAEREARRLNRKGAKIHDQYDIDERPKPRKKKVKTRR